MVRDMSNAEATAPKQRVIGTPFPKGTSGNPAGRPKGSKQRLATAFIDDLSLAWQEHGAEALRQTATKKPWELVRCVALLLPRDVAVDVTVAHEIGGVLEAYRAMAATLGANPQVGLRRLRQLEIEHDAAER
jgi:hypothetical protein